MREDRSGSGEVQKISTALSRGWLFPYVRSRVLPGEFHPITAYLFGRIQVQSRLLVLLVLQQQGKGHDRRCCPAFDRTGCTTMAAGSWR